MRKESELIEHLQILGLNKDEARIYIYLVQNGSVDEERILSVLKVEGKSAIDSLIGKGTIIKDPSNSSSFLALHPRNAAANLYKLQEDKALNELREKRKVADRLGMVLEPVFEESQHK
ncbi:MAG TPA: helix-turn-helix domain-containing protein [Nitrososphaerales archaeon]